MSKLKEQYILLNKEYSDESLVDLERDVAEIHDFPEDKEYSNIINNSNHGFKGGNYLVLIVYVPGEGDEV